jgi:hypothetical protein
MERYRYQVSDINGFKALLDHLAGMESYPPIFVVWGAHEDDCIVATFHVEADLFLAAFTMHADKPKDIDDFKAAHEHHRFIDAELIHGHDEQMYDAL